MFQHFSQKGLITADEFSRLLDNHGVVAVDASYALPNSGVDTKQNYTKERIPDARFFDIEKISDRTTNLPHMLPTPENFEDEMCAMGISNDDFIVIYGQGDMAMGPARAWWMFHVFGHKNVAVLDGGLRAWKAFGGNVERAPDTSFHRTNYKVSIKNEALICDYERMKVQSANGKSIILDARPKSRFDGTQPEPRAGLHSGHIPGSYNIPAGSLSNSENGKLLEPEVLREKFSKIIPSKNDEILLTCGSGVTACMLGLALYSLGYHKAAVYDGSWAEWGAMDSGNPVDVTE